MTVKDKCVALVDSLKTHVVERDEEIEVLFMAILAKLNILFLGSPGVAKTMMALLFTDSIFGATIFTKLINKFTVPEDILGPLKISLLKQDIYERNIENTLLTAHFAFMDEIFKGNIGILNTFLDIMLEKTYVNGTHKISLPLLSMIGASNEIPEEGDGLAAMYDRFIVKLTVKPIVEDENFIKMLKLIKVTPEATLSLDEIHQAQTEVENIPIKEDVYFTLTKIRTRLIQEGMCPSDRTFKLSLNFLKARAYLLGKNEVIEEDLECLKHTLWTDPDKFRQVNSIILELCNPLMNTIYSLLDEAKELYSSATVKSKTVKKDDTDPHIFDIASKLNGIKDELVKYAKIMKDQGQSLKKIMKVQEQVDEMTRTLLENAIKNQGFFGNATAKQK